MSPAAREPDRVRRAIEKGNAPRGHFRFGENWSRFLRLLTEDRIVRAEDSLQEWLGATALHGVSFLDIGCGSGLFSLAARRLGARVRSFDADPLSVECASELRRSHFPDDPDWTVERGSILDLPFVTSLGHFDVVYSWGVLHHTGALRESLENAMIPLGDGGRLWLALYNDQGRITDYWRAVKTVYNRGVGGRAAMLTLHIPYVAARVIVRAATGRWKLERGMSMWYDLKDWLGGYPFEVAGPADVIAFFQDRGLRLDKARTVGRRNGCNEFLFRAAGPR